MGDSSKAQSPVTGKETLKTKPVVEAEPKLGQLSTEMPQPDHKPRSIFLTWPVVQAEPEPWNKSERLPSSIISTWPVIQAEPESWRKSEWIQWYENLFSKPDVFGHYGLELSDQDEPLAERIKIAQRTLEDCAGADDFITVETRTEIEDVMFKAKIDFDQRRQGNSTYKADPRERIPARKARIYNTVYKPQVFHSAEGEVIARPDDLFDLGPYYHESYSESCWYRTAPGPQFQYQVAVEMERISEQLEAVRMGRKPIFSYDESLTLRENAQRNIKEFWSKMGIWAEEWNVSCWWNPSEFKFGLIWGHERSLPSSSIIPEPSNSEAGRYSEVGKYSASQRDWSEMRPQRDPKALEKASFPPGQHKDVPYPFIEALQKVTVRDPEASKPRNQFIAQVSREAEWLKDELNWQQLEFPSQIDIDRVVNLLARKFVQNHWEEQRLVNSQWYEDRPGEDLIWKHEAWNALTLKMLEADLND